MAAPLQGITEHVWREAHARVCGGVARYYTPFLRMMHGEIPRREQVDATAALSESVACTPQVIACPPQQATHIVDWLVAQGHREVDINLGCPFPPVALKKMGSGMLPYPALVEQLFTALAGIEGVRYSVKMRLGWDEATQWREVMPLTEILQPAHITVHPCTGRGKEADVINHEQMAAIVAASPYPIIYNGGINTRDDIARIVERYPTLAGVMVGRGLVARPDLTSDAGTACYRPFHDQLVEGYRQRYSQGGEAQILRHLQDLWAYFLPDAPARLRKAIKKSRTLAQYYDATTALFTTLEN